MKLNVKLARVLVSQIWSQFQTAHVDLKIKVTINVYFCILILSNSTIENVKRKTSHIIYLQENIGSRPFENIHLNNSPVI